MNTTFESALKRKEYKIAWALYHIRVYQNQINAFAASFVVLSVRTAQNYFGRVIKEDCETLYTREEARKLRLPIK